MEGKHDITTIDDIKHLVNSFYDAAKKDVLIGPVFNAKVKDWDKHLNIMYTFWETVILDAYTYKGSPFNQHKDLPIDKEHFDRWVSLFSKIVDENFTGTNANNAKQRAQQFATVFWSKMEFMRG
jgi:hemoglobin